MRKSLLVALLLPLFCSCSLFEKTPESVIEGQRGVYQSTIVNEEHVNLIIDEYIKDNLATITYHYNFIYEIEIDKIRKDPDLSREQKSLEISRLEKDRDSHVNNGLSRIQAKATEFKVQSQKNYDITKRLIESVYYYLSTNPITIDNIDFWLKRINKDGASQN